MGTMGWRCDMTWTCNNVRLMNDVIYVGKSGVAPHRSGVSREPRVPRSGGECGERDQIVAQFDTKP
jgi:hypothetical protein